MAAAYRSSMDSPRLRCRLIALTAAYAVALHALLSAFVPLGPATLGDPLAVLCAHDQDGGKRQQPASHDPTCAAICAAMSHGVAGFPPPGQAVAMAGPLVMFALAPGSDWVSPRPAAHRPQAPRAPPPA
jgi:hypothetical protein